MHWLNCHSVDGDRFWQNYVYKISLAGPTLTDKLAKFGPPWGTNFGKGRPILAAKIGLGDQCWQQKWSGEPVLACLSAIIQTNFGVTVPQTT